MRLNDRTIMALNNISKPLPNMRGFGGLTYSTTYLNSRSTMVCIMLGMKIFEK